MTEIMKKTWVSLIVLVALTTASQAGTIAWKVGQDGTWTTGSKWTGGTAPVTGDSVNLGTGGGDDIQLNTTFAIQSGQSMDQAAGEFILISNSVLTLAAGGTMDIAFMRPRYSSGGQFIIEAGADLHTDTYGLGSIAGDIKYIADAAGVTTWYSSGTSAGQFAIGLDNLTVDLTNYNISSGYTLILVDYETGALSGEFASVTIIGGWTGLTIDYAYDQGGGDLAIALTVPLPNTVITTPGLTIEFNSNAVPVSVTDSGDVELLDQSSASEGFYVLEGNGSKRYFDSIYDLGDNEYRFGISGSSEKIEVAFDGVNDYMTVRFTSITGFALDRERLYFGLNGLTDYGLQAMGLDYMIEASNSAGVKVQRRSLWETDNMGGFAIYERIDDEAEDETLLDLWVDEGIAHPAVAGAWDRTAAEAWLDAWIDEAYDTTYLNMNPTNLAQHDDFIPYAQMLGAKAMYFHNWKGVQDDELNPAMYPNGLSDMEDFRDALAIYDIDLMFHNMSSYVSRSDPEFVTGATVDPGVENWGTVTLESAITSSSTSFMVIPDTGVEMPSVSTSSRPLEASPVIPADFNFRYFRIEGEWIKAGSVTDLGNGTWQLDAVARAQLSTTAASHAAETSLRGYITKNHFSSDPDSALTETMTSRWGILSNTLGLTHASFDGAYWRMAQGFWSFEKYATLMYQNLDHVTSANTSHGRPPQAWLEYKFNRVKAAMGGDFQTREQISFFLGDESRTTPSLEEMEFNAYTFSQVNNRGFSVGVNGSLGVSLASLENHGRTGEILYKLRDWKDASLAMSESQREAMNSFSASRTGLGAKYWAYSFWRSEGDVFRRWYGLGTDLYNHEWYTGQEHGTVAPRFYVNNGEQVNLSASSDLASGFNQVRVVGRMLPRFDVSSGSNIDLMTPMGLGSSLTVARTNTKSSASWNAGALIPYAVSLNLSGHTGIGMYVTGDGSGATLVVRLANGLGRDYAVPINFTGRQWVEIPTGEQGWRLRTWGWSSDTKKTINYGSIKTISIGIGHLPPNTACSVEVDGLAALAEINDPMVNPTITVGNQSVNVAGTINTGNHFILDPDGTFTIYDKDWNTISAESLSGLLPSNLDSFKMESTSASSDIWLEVGVQAATETMANPVWATTPPIITLLGTNPMNVIQGNPFTDPGATAFDNRDGDMTASIVVSGSVDTGTIGTYYLDYDVTDSNDNAAITVTRTVNVTLPSVVTWTHATDTKWETAGNWDTGTVPVSGADSVVLNDTIGGASKGEAFISSAFTIGNGYSMTTAGSGTGEDIKLSNNAVLTLATGGTLDIGILTRANTASSNMRFTIEDGATANLYRYVSGEDTTTEFIANAAGVTTVHVSDSITLDFADGDTTELVPDALEVDLSSYDIANGNKLILFDYDSLVGTFATVTLTEGWSGTIDYAYDQGGGDMAIAITDLKVPGDVIAPNGVDFADFAVFAAAWQSYEGDSNWNESCNLAAPDNVIDIADLVVFCENWLAGI